MSKKAKLPVTVPGRPLTARFHYRKRFFSCFGRKCSDLLLKVQILQNRQGGESGSRRQQ